MIAVAWFLTVVAWLGHLGLLFEDGSAAYGLLTGHASGMLLLLLVAALLPQLWLIPWAWRNVDLAPCSLQAKRLWRLAFFCTGFLGTTLYLLVYWRPRLSQD